MTEKPPPHRAWYFLLPKMKLSASELQYVLRYARVQRKARSSLILTGHKIVRGKIGGKVRWDENVIDEVNDATARLDIAFDYVGKRSARAYGLQLQSVATVADNCLLYTSPSPRDRTRSRMPSSA